MRTKILKSCDEHSKDDENATSRAFGRTGPGKLPKSIQTVILGG